MSRQRIRRRLSTESLETRKLMAGDAFTITGVDDAILDDTQSTEVTISGGDITGNTAAEEGGGLWNGVTIPAGQTTGNRSMDDASPDLVQHLNRLDADATDAVMARYQRSGFEDKAGSEEMY